MSDSLVFQWMSRALEAATPWNALAARGTVRLTLKKAGLHPDTVSKTEMIVVIDRLLPKELEVRGVDDAKALCQQIRLQLQEEDFDVAFRQRARPEEVFSRVLGSSRRGSGGIQGKDES